MEDPRLERLFPREHVADHRRETQRDRDRIMFSYALQRLAGVTQVSSSVEGFAFHNRLTHTLEMAQIGRRLTEKLNDELGASDLASVAPIEPDIVEAACLAHDIGHPPFGHLGETVLDEVARRYELEQGFEANAQSLRIVTTLEPYRRQFLGMNLTRATLNALLKYPVTRRSKGSFRKWGVYEMDWATVEWARSMLPEPRATVPETQLMDIADDIAYSVHDVQDFYRAQLIPLDRLSKSPRERDRFIEMITSDSGIQYRRDELKETLADVLADSNPFRTGFVVEPYVGSREQRGHLRAVTSALIKRFAAGVRIHRDATGRAMIGFDDKTEKEVFLLKALTRKYVHESFEVATRRAGYAKMIYEVAEFFMQAALRRDYTVFPALYRNAIEGDDPIQRTVDAGDKRRLRIVVDMIAGMTDDQVYSFFCRISGSAGPLEMRTSWV